MAPDFIKRRKPAKQLQILYLRKISRKRLIKMVMCVDEPGIKDEFGRIDDAVGVNLVVSYVIDCVFFDAQVASSKTRSSPSTVTMALAFLNSVVFMNHS